MSKNKLPADKQSLLAAENYEIFNRDLLRKVFPRILRELKEENKRVKAGDLIPFYFTLLSYIDGVEYLSDGATPNASFGAAFPNQSTVHEITGIDTRRQTWLAEVLKQNGLLLDYEEKYINLRRYIFYYPSFCPDISDDGFVIDAETGEKITQDVPFLMTELKRINKR